MYGHRRPVECRRHWMPPPPGPAASRGNFFVVLISDPGVLIKYDARMARPKSLDGSRDWLNPLTPCLSWLHRARLPEYKWSTKGSIILIRRACTLGFRAVAPDGVAHHGDAFPLAYLSYSALHHCLGQRPKALSLDLKAYPDKPAHFPVAESEWLRLISGTHMPKSVSESH